MEFVCNAWVFPRGTPFFCSSNVKLTDGCKMAPGVSVRTCTFVSIAL